ncbi:MAG: hypothetical protein BJ554DRAFT_3887 [Olpidium bornovanus]|uniref:DUF6787 domain-containing protein n=1 Tax=Olpidium bornovanus TaxID=278681 RepID=A0A8H7ZN05_9FUNG|nr:MAG: hypothetical protein BJ554DRAFT_3887 [Olpidium bornovanus]
MAGSLHFPVLSRAAAAAAPARAPAKPAAARRPPAPRPALPAKSARGLFAAAVPGASCARLPRRRRGSAAAAAAVPPVAPRPKFGFLSSRATPRAGTSPPVRRVWPGGAPRGDRLLQGRRGFLTAPFRDRTPDFSKLERFSPSWWKEWGVVMAVFAVTGSSTMLLVRPFVNDFMGFKGTFKEGPWSFRVAYILTTLPGYSMMLVTVGTLAGRHAYFRGVALKMWSRLVPAKWLGKDAVKSP